MQNLHMSEQKRKLESRTNTRNHVFNLVFQLPFWDKEEKMKILNSYYETLEDETAQEIKKDENFIPLKINKQIIEKQFFDIADKLDLIDEKISQVSSGWSLERIDKVDLAILRLAMYELLFEDDIPQKVVINEAIILAKEYSSEKSYKFINALLAKAIA